MLYNNIAFFVIINNIYIYNIYIIFYIKEGKKMNSLIKIVPNVKKFNDYLFEVKKGTTPIMLSGLTDVEKSIWHIVLNFIQKNQFV